ncbi:MAG: VCBS repeat-containing protein, partial [Verrucomicrobiota bacterium]
YVANNRTDDIRDRGQVDLRMLKGKLIIPPELQDRLLVVNGKVLEYGEPDQLFLNDGKGHFTPVPWTGGSFLDEDGKKLSQPPRDWGLTAMFRDLNGDGFPDLYVCNDYWTPDRVWLNDGVGHFRAIANLVVRCTSASSMGVDFADVDRDGNVDCFVVDMLSRDHRLRLRQMLAHNPVALPVGATDNRPQIMRNTFLHNRGDGTFEEIANFAGLQASDWSWSPVFLDVDLDGFEDLLISAGHAKDVQDLDAGIQIEARQHSYSGFTNPVERLKAFVQDRMLNGRLYPYLHTPIVAFRNMGNLKFEETTAIWGTDQPGIHHGIALGDLDGDGDLDFAVNNLNGACGLYRNDCAAPRVAVRLKGLPSNTQGIGAKITLLHGTVPFQSQEVISGGRYMSGSDPMLVFAAGNAISGMVIEVSWRSGKRSRIEDVRLNRVYEIDEAGAVAGGALERRSVGASERGSVGASERGSVGASKRQSATAMKSQDYAPPLFKDVSDLIGHIHHQEAFDDFARQPLLPFKRSQLGPGVAWFDVDGDGWDDLMIGSGKGGELAVYRNNRKGGFAPMTEPLFHKPVTRDQTTLLGWFRPDAKPVIFAGSANYEDGLALGAGVRQYDLSTGTVDDSLPAQASSTGPLAMADTQGDGNLELFVGGRVVPGRYPESASSRIYRFESGRWQVDVQNSRILEKVGLVSGAVWSDLDGDGFPELILACEWGPIRVFQNAKGKLHEITADLGLANYTGWWNGVTTGDLDGDGRFDIIAANWGLNSPYHATPERPIRFYYGDFVGRNAIDIIETEFDPIRKAIVPRRRLDVVATALPAVRERFPTHKAFSEATIAEVLGPQQVRGVAANTLASMVFLNRGNRFEPVELDREAQLAPAFAVNVADFDGDGHEDVFLSQNFFALQPETPRLDAGRGLWLRNDGSGKLIAVPGQNSGIKVYGEQRGAAVADFNRDGRVDLVVTQNGAETKLFQNLSAKPGLRVRLAGPPGNPPGIGATIRLKFGERFGPAREIHAGSGYWSQDSAVQVLAVPQTPAELWIRWPGGRITTTPLSTFEGEVTVDSTGKTISSR